MKRNHNLSVFGTAFGLPFALSLLFSQLLPAQSAINTDRNSYTILYVAEPKGAGPLFQQGLNTEFRNRFDWNLLPTKSFVPTEYNLDQMAEQLTRTGIGRQLMTFWWQRQPDGSFKLDTIAQRGRINSRVHDSIIVNLGPRGDKQLEETGLRLIPRSYVVVLRPLDLRSMEEDYNRQAQAARQNGSNTKIERLYRGYKGSIEVYVFKFNYDSIAKNVFYEMWPFADDSPELRKQKSEQFNQSDAFKLLPYIHYTIDEVSHLVSIEDKSKKTDKTILGKDLILKTLNPGSLVSTNSEQEMLAQWASKAVNKVFDKLVGKEDGFGTTLAGIRPIRAEIGRKDGLHTEKRYILYEKKERLDGSFRLARRAVVRATNQIADNRNQVGSADVYSRFYRVGGLGLIHKGMIIKERREAGIGIHALYALGQSEQLSDLGAGAELNLSLYLAKLGLRRVPTGLRVGINYTWSLDTIWVLSSQPIKADGTRLSFYLRKDIHFLSIMRLGLWAGYGSETMTERTKEEKKRSIETAFVPVGAEFGINILPGINAFGQAEYFIPVGSVMEGDKERSDWDWGELYPRRNGLCTRVGLRYTF
jgi:hypothetical protein